MRSDEALLEAWLAGELAAFDLLYARYEAPLFGFIRRLCGGNAADAEDVLSATFLALMNEAKRRRVTRVKSLLYEIARNACLNRARALKRESPAQVQSEVATPEVRLVERETAVALSKALDTMPTQLTETWSLRASGLSYDEISKLLAVPVGTVKSRMNQLLTRLREVLR